MSLSNLWEYMYSWKFDITIAEFIQAIKS